MNRIGKWFEGRTGTEVILVVSLLCAIAAIWWPLYSTFILSWLGIVIPQFTMYRNAQLARKLAGEPEDE